MYNDNYLSSRGTSCSNLPRFCVFNSQRLPSPSESGQLEELRHKVAALETELVEKEQHVKKLTDLFSDLVSTKNAKIAALEAELEQYKAAQRVGSMLTTLWLSPNSNFGRCCSCPLRHLDGGGGGRIGHKARICFTTKPID